MHRIYKSAYRRLPPPFFEVVVSVVDVLSVVLVSVVELLDVVVASPTTTVTECCPLLPAWSAAMAVIVWLVPSVTLRVFQEQAVEVVPVQSSFPST